MMQMAIAAVTFPFTRIFAAVGGAMEIKQWFTTRRPKGGERLFTVSQQPLQLLPATHAEDWRLGWLWKES
jgi:hypothetical protein